MKLLVTGGAGFIGSNFVRYLLANTTDVSLVNFDALTYAGNLNNLTDVASDKRYTFVQGDVCNPTAVSAAMRGCDAMVHFAAESHVDRSIYEPGNAVQTNIQGTFVLLQAAREDHIRRFIHISTDEVYGDLPPNVTADESFPLRPSSPYAASKASADLLVSAFVRTFDFPAIIIRASNNYGSFQFPEKFLPLMISNALEDKPIPVYGDGLQQRNWLFVDDCCAGILAVLKSGRVGETYNVGGSEVVENLALTKKVLSAMAKPESLIRHVADRPGHDRRYALDSSKIRSELGWIPRVPLVEGLRKTIDWYCASAEWITQTKSGLYRAYYQKYYEDRSSSLRDLLRPNLST